MTKKFEFECGAADLRTPDLCRMLKAEISIQCSDSDCADAEYTIEYLEDMTTGDEVKVESLEAADQAKLEKECQAYADELGHEAYSEYCQGKADWAYDNYMDRLSDEASES